MFGSCIPVNTFFKSIFVYLFTRVLSKFGSDALASPFDEAKAIVSVEFFKMFTETLITKVSLSFLVPYT